MKFPSFQMRAVLCLIVLIALASVQGERYGHNRNRDCDEDDEECHEGRRGRDGLDGRAGLPGPAGAPGPAGTSGANGTGITVLDWNGAGEIFNNGGTPFFGGLSISGPPAVENNSTLILNRPGTPFSGFATSFTPPFGGTTVFANSSVPVSNAPSFDMFLEANSIITPTNLTITQCIFQARAEYVPLSPGPPPLPDDFHFTVWESLLPAPPTPGTAFATPANGFTRIFDADVIFPANNGSVDGLEFTGTAIVTGPVAIPLGTDLAVSVSTNSTFDNLTFNYGIANFISFTVSCSATAP